MYNTKTYMYIAIAIGNKTTQQQRQWTKDDRQQQTTEGTGDFACLLLALGLASSLLLLASHPPASQPRGQKTKTKAGC